MRLDCGKCVVRDWSRSDQQSLVRLANNRNIARNLLQAFPHPYTEADAERWFAFLAQMAEPTYWAIDVQGDAVGGIGVRIGEAVVARSGELSYWLGEPYWGRGIMTAAVVATSRYAMARFGLARLEAHVFGWNTASMRVLDKCGFCQEGVLRAGAFKDGEIVDHILYALVVKQATYSGYGAT